MGGCFGKRSGDFIIHVQTGDRRNAGTDAKVQIRLHDEYSNSSEPITLDNYFRNDFERGQLDTFYVSADKVQHLQSMGKICRVELWRDDAWVASDWYVDKIVVENRVTNYSYVFPIFRWIKAKYHYHIKHLDTSLPQHEEFPDQRKMELADKRKAYEFDQKIEGAPAQVKAMPSDEQFSFDYKWDIVTLKAKLIASSILVKLMASGEWESIATLCDVYNDSTFQKPKWDIVTTKIKLIAVSKIVMLTKGEWESLSDLKNVYTKDVFYCPYKGADRWSNDLYFGLQRVASLNHSLIRLVTEIPEKFPVTDELLKPLLEGYTIAEAIADKKLFMCDLKMLNGISVRENFTLCIPIVLLYCDKSEQLKPIAIQLFQDPGPNNPIFTPLCPSLTWALVKMWYNNADAAYHQALTHLGYTHLLMEGVTVATHRNLSQSHPIFKLLAPHFLYLIAINTRGLELLIAEGGWVDKTMNYGTKGLMELIIKGLNQWRMDVDGTLPEDLKRRGLDDTKVLPCYHFRNDALLLHSAIKKYVRSYIDLYYSSSDLLENDHELQGWVEELVKPRNKSAGGVGILGVPGNGKIKTVEQLEMIVTSIIYTCSISHASTNFPQYDEYAFPPNYPGLLRGKPPNNPTMVASERDILNALPDRPTTLDIMIVTKILSSKGTKSIGDFEVQFIFDPPACEIVNQFRKDLHAIGVQIKERNRHRNPPYEYLTPDIIPNSISI